MKKVNLLIGVLYINTLILAAIDSYFFKTFIELTAHFVTKTEPKLTGTFGSSGFYDKLPDIFYIWVVLFALVSLLNIISLIVDGKKNNLEKLYKKMKRIKMALIPYWVLNFIFYIPISTILLVAGHGFGFLIVPLFIFASFIVLVLTSLFSISYLYRLLKNNKISGKQFALNAGMQLFFVIDIIDTLYIMRKWGGQNAA